MRLRNTIVVALLASAVLAGCGSTTAIRNPSPNAIAYALTQDQVRQTIVTSALARNWRIVEQGPSELRLAYPSGTRSQKYEVLAKVSFSDTQYAVSYLSSRGLDEKTSCSSSPIGICAHKNVNRWLLNLDHDIARRLNAAALKPAAASAP